MNRNKKILAAGAVIFLVLLAYASYDIARRTTFPGSKAQLPARIEETLTRDDTTVADSINNGKLK